jgi:putative membrane protein insertion efficiency factor
VNGERGVSRQAADLLQAPDGFPAEPRSSFTVHRSRLSLTAVPRLALMAVVRGYQLTISPVLPPACRFTPTCSQYALEAIQRYGAVRGAWLAARRLTRCHPFHPGGFDPVP